MNLYDYLAASLPDSVRVFGCKLKPVTLGHVLLLHRIESPLVCDGSIQFGDVYLAAEILKRNTADAKRAIEGEWLARWMRFTGPYLLTRFKPWEMQGAIVDAHLASAFAQPTIWKKDNGVTNNDPGGVPWLLERKVLLMDWLHKTEAEALNTPLAEATWELTVAAEIRGNVKIVSDLEKAMMGNWEEPCQRN
jgi:hypothetical protein